jgi:hypothetical protein
MPCRHRIVRLAPLNGAPCLETKGDANATVDPAIVSVASVVGRVAVQLPLGFLAVSGTLLCLVWLIEDLETDQRPICAGPSRTRSS